MTTYLVYRIGSNSANQSMRQRMPVAIVEAKSRAEAIEAHAPERPSIRDCAWLVLAPSVSAWANQRFEAVPVSRAPAADVREIQESEGAR